jgi:hypothetical protein
MRRKTRAIEVLLRSQRRSRQQQPPARRQTSASTRFWCVASAHALLIACSRTALLIQARYTSEDNASFNALLAKMNAQRAARLPVAAARAAEAAAAAHTAAMRHAADTAAASTAPLLLCAGEAGEEGAGSSVQVFAGVASGRHVAKNSLFYSPDGRALTLSEAEAGVKGPPRGVNIGATRFGGTHTADAPPAGELRAAVARTPGLRGCVPRAHALSNRCLHHTH